MLLLLAKPAAANVSANAALASGSGAANAAATQVSTNAALAAGTGAAYDAGHSTSAAAGHAAGLATSGGSGLPLLLGGGVVTDPRGSVGPSAELAAGTGTAYRPFIDVPFVDTSGSGRADWYPVSDPPLVDINAGIARGSGLARNATIETNDDDFVFGLEDLLELVPV